MRNSILTIALMIVASSSVTAVAPPAKSPCIDPLYHQFDFWVGKWDVYGPKGRKIAQSLIEPVYGCGIRENWMPLNGENGGSLSVYVPGQKRWEQFYFDTSGERAYLQGGWTGERMVLNRVWDSDQKGRPLNRMSYEIRPNGDVRQFGESSTDQGRTWSVTFDLLYRRSGSR